MVNDLASVVTGADLTKLVHVIHGRHVVVDCDLTALYGVETKVFNRAVKRNTSRFPEHFRFQLTQEECDNLRSQFVTSSGGGRRCPPYVFAEQGVAILSAVLRGATAIEVSIGIRPYEAIPRQWLDQLRGKEVIERVYSDDSRLRWPPAVVCT